MSSLKSRDFHLTVPTFDFFFKFPIPKPKKERIITERDSLGRIIKSKLFLSSSKRLSSREIVMD